MTKKFFPEHMDLSQKFDFLIETAYIHDHPDIECEPLVQELLDEYADLEQQLKRSKSENTRLIAIIQQWEDAAKIAASEECTKNEKHCTCVPLLRQQLAASQQRVKVLDDTINECEQKAGIYGTPITLYMWVESILAERDSLKREVEEWKDVRKDNVDMYVTEIHLLQDRCADLERDARKKMEKK